MIDSTFASEASELQIIGGWQSILGSTVVSMPSSYTDQERSSWLLSERRQWQRGDSGRDETASETDFQLIAAFSFLHCSRLLCKD